MEVKTKTITKKIVTEHLSASEKAQLEQYEAKLNHLKQIAKARQTKLIKKEQADLLNYKIKLVEALLSRTDFVEATFQNRDLCEVNVKVLHGKRKHTKDIGKLIDLLRTDPNR
jgi:uncharacterized protein YjbI with pentapeptide repeats